MKHEDPFNLTDYDDGSVYDTDTAPSADTAPTDGPTDGPSGSGAVVLPFADRLRKGSADPDEGADPTPAPTANPTANPTADPSRSADRAPTPAADPDDRDDEGDDEDEEGEGRPVPADPPDLPSPGITTERRRPIVPEWARNRADFVVTAKHTAGNIGYATAFHGIRTPYYAGRLSVAAPKGALRLVKATNRWVWDLEAAPLRAHAVKEENAGEYLTLMRARDRHVRLRVLLATVGSLFGVGMAITLYVLGSGWVLLFASIGILTLGWFGQEPDRPIVGPAVVKTEVQKLTTSLVLRALGSIGNAAINRALAKGGQGIDFTSEITRDGPGYRAELDLPFGVVPDEVIEKRAELASGLRRKVGCVWPAPDPTAHEGRLILWVGDRPMNELKKPEWPLAKTGTVDLFQPAVFGNDFRMRPVEVTLMFASVIVGSIPRMGKTFLMRLLLLIAALDPRAELHAFDLKGTGDFRPLEPVCHRYRAGDEAEDIRYVLLALREIQEEMRRRTKVINSLPSNLCPENKVTSQLASDKRYRLHPIVVALDECQKAFEHKEYGAEIEEICTDLVKRGPALGIIAMFGTQRPDAKSLPTGISANAVLRFCLKVMGQVENDMVLGTSMYKAGYRATMFSRSDRGIAWMAGEGDDPRIVCSAFIDQAKAEQVARRARALREAYGNVTGHAAGQAPADTENETAAVVLDDVAHVLTGEDTKVWSETVVDRLAAYKPHLYAEWARMEPKAKAEQLTAALKPFNIGTEQIGRRIDGKTVNKRGIVREHVLTALTKRNQERAAK